MKKSPFEKNPDLDQDDESNIDDIHQNHTNSLHQADDHEELLEDDDGIENGRSSKTITKTIQKVAVPLMGLAVIVWMVWPTPSPVKVLPKKTEVEIDIAKQKAQTTEVINNLQVEAEKTRLEETKDIAQKQAQNQPRDGYVNPNGDVVPKNNSQYQPPQQQTSTQEADKQKYEAEKREADIRASSLEVAGIKLLTDSEKTPKRSKIDDLQDDLLQSARKRSSDAELALSGQDKALLSMNQPQKAPVAKSQNESFIDAQDTEGTYKLVKQHGAPVNPILFEGTVIRATLLTAVNSDMPGKIRAIVQHDVYDSVTQRKVLIPKGSWLIGAYNNQISVGQERLLIAMTRLIRPDGTWVSLAGSSAVDEQGRSGLDADVNNHFFKMFGSSLIVGASSFFLGGRDVTSTSQNGNGSSQTSGSVLGTALNNTVTTLMERNRNISPTLSKDGGISFMFMVAHDIELTPYTSQH